MLNYPSLENQNNLTPTFASEIHIINFHERGNTFAIIARQEHCFLENGWYSHKRLRMYKALDLAFAKHGLMMFTQNLAHPGKSGVGHRLG